MVKNPPGSIGDIEMLPSSSSIGDIGSIGDIEMLPSRSSSSR